MTWNMTEMDVIRTAEDKNLIDGDVRKHILKSTIALGSMNNAIESMDEHAMKLAFGDALIGMIIAAAQLDLDLTKCLELSYEKFKRQKFN